MAKSALVLGGGFAGLEAAIQLRKAGLDVTLVSDRPYLFIYPTSIWIPTGAPFESSCLDLPDLARRHGFTFVEGAVTAVSGARRAATVGRRELSADFLLLALGAERMRPKGVEHTHFLGGDPKGTARLRDALAALVERGHGRIAIGFGGNPKDPSAMRGGPAFELAFNVDTMLRAKGLREKFELTFFAPMPSPGERMGKRAAAATQAMLARVGFATRFGKKISGFEPGAVLLEDGARVEADLVTFIPAGEGHPVLKGSDLPRNEAGFAVTDGGCAVAGFPGVYAIGDSAALLGPEWRAKQGHVAEVMARTAAANVAAEAAGRSDRASYVEHVDILCLLDMGNGGAWVHRDARKERLIPLPVVGHWLKKGWGAYYKLSKKRLVPRIPGM